MANKRNTGAWKAPKDFTITERMANGYWTDKADDFVQEASPELRRDQRMPEAGWPKLKYVVQRMHMGWSGDDIGMMDRAPHTTDGRGKEAARTDRGPKNKWQSDSNRGGRVKRNGYFQRGNTG